MIGATPKPTEYPTLDDDTRLELLRMGVPEDQVQAVANAEYAAQRAAAAASAAATPGAVPGPCAVAIQQPGAAIGYAAHLVPVVRLFSRVWTQWRTASMGAHGVVDIVFLGLDYSAVDVAARWLRIDLNAQQLDWLRVMELEANRCYNNMDSADESTGAVRV